MTFDVGLEIDVKTAASERVYTGIIYYSDGGLLVLQDGESWHILKTTGLKVVNAARKPLQHMGLRNLPPISLENIRMRETGACLTFPYSPLLPALAGTNKARTQASRIGKDVSKEAQDIFDELSKTLPVAWREKDILVMNEVLIAAPKYSVAQARSSSSNSPSLPRVSKVLAGIREKLNLDL
ncbi:MAG: hypothetical protein SGCHY_001727 [Lobulomycetales sp.]